MPRRTYAPKSGRRRPPGGNPDALAALAAELRWRRERPTEPTYEQQQERDTA